MEYLRGRMITPESGLLCWPFVRPPQNPDRPGGCVGLADPSVGLRCVAQRSDRLHAYQPRSSVHVLVILRGPEDVFDRPPILDIEHHDTHPITAARKAILREIPR